MDRQELIAKIQKLKRKRKAIILVHNYQLPEIQDIADYLGDSLELSRIAAKSDAKIIVFCGVRFMAETAAILSPYKKVLIPDPNAGCPLADMITPRQLRELKQKHPGVPAVAYVNTSAALKAEADVCCTSANGIKVVNALRDSLEVIFVPDKYLGNYVFTQTGRKLMVWDGFCPVHVNIFPEDIQQKKRLYPKAKVMAHPECRPEVLRLADAVVSTGGMCRFAKENPAGEFIVGTEIGINYRLEKENPEKRFYSASELAVCFDMKKITLEKVLQALENMQYQVKIPEQIRLKAKGAVDKMVEII